ncbi:pentapeptide repeat-containing protein [Leptolyngbya sp. GB1-A1]|uniref:pentapeptide repeat-containing protein n=1 Tax=Leptolyngbya sp. GB1-A1 TaxID=2933908 RepID=UPI0032978978
MAEPASFEELEQAIGSVLDAKTTDFFELAEMLGLDPKQDFAGADLSGADFLRGDLAGASFVETNLCGANFAYANLKEANLTNADLGILPSSYLARTKELNHLITSEIATTRARDLAFTLARDIATTRDLASASASASASAFTLARDIAFDIARDLDRDLDIAFARDRAFDRAFTLAFDIAFARDRAFDLAFDIAFARDRAFARTHVYDLIRTIGGGANFYKANLSGVMLNGANVEGAVMIGCTGLSDSEIADLKRRGAIFDRREGDRSEVHEPIPR